ncbi:hypothetical protein [Synechococcus sp. MIT S1220]|uniref:hypothetical protein n=1 Tax=Synechococcus sp. MIT S1220 TaxID=3082549 RepID=UPI0039B0D071
MVSALEKWTMPLAAGLPESGRCMTPPWSESWIRNLNCVAANGIQSEDQRWPWWQLLPLNSKLPEPV